MPIHPNSLKNLKPFKKGQIANPKGRPKGIGLSEALQMLAKEVVTAKNGQKLPRNLALAHLIWQQALDPRSKHFGQCMQTIYDRSEGKALERVAQQMDLSGGMIVPKAHIPEPPKPAQAKHVKQGKQKKETT